MSLNTLSNQVISLAGVYQACAQVKSVAWRGHYEPCLLDTAVDSIFKLDAENMDDVYGGRDKVRYGLEIMARELNPTAVKVDQELTRYVLNLLSIEKKLSRKPDLTERIRKAISAATTQLEHFGKQHPNTLAALADIYQRTISQIKPRIMVDGERIHLSNESNASRIRTLLLAALRSMVLWRQCGGNRLKFLIRRREYFHEASSLLAS